MRNHWNGGGEPPPPRGVVPLGPSMAGAPSCGMTTGPASNDPPDGMVDKLGPGGRGTTSALTTCALMGVSNDLTRVRGLTVSSSGALGREVSLPLLGRSSSRNILRLGRVSGIMVELGWEVGCPANVDWSRERDSVTICGFAPASLIRSSDMVTKLGWGAGRTSDVDWSRQRDSVTICEPAPTLLG